MTNTVLAQPLHRTRAVRWNRTALFLARHWFALFALIAGLYVGLPWLAPVFMKLGLAGAGQAIYAVYSTQCHQLPERSFFLFGEKSMYSLVEIQSAWRNTNNPVILRQFIGNGVMGWKVAWSDRMVSLFTSMWAGMILARILDRRLKPMRWWFLVLLALPLALDGGAHFWSDLAGIGGGFRDTNAWLAGLTGNAFPAWFYAGDALGSFNSLMRLVTGVWFGFGLAWFAYPYLKDELEGAAAAIEEKFRHAGLPA